MTRQEFIDQIAPIICQYAAAYGYRFPSAIIAQACIESAFKTFFMCGAGATPPHPSHPPRGLKWTQQHL